uniref:Uncharacterized protein n=1 Tax=Lactuca sativa TaxID=4236 RepID=A0A9R1VT51_LACSA|nr:hypothetical protein LSAT_V11C400193940 [Lactuca sativa]
MLSFSLKSIHEMEICNYGKKDGQAVRILKTILHKRYYHLISRVIDKVGCMQSKKGPMALETMKFWCGRSNPKREISEDQYTNTFGIV